MKLENLFLKKEELPILYKTCFEIPIHPKLLDPAIQIDESIAQELFPQAAEDWYKDLKNYSPETNQEKEWIDGVFLKEKPKIEKHLCNQYLFGFWRDEINFADNGFVTGFSISRDGGGSIYFNDWDDYDHHKTLIPNPYILFSKEKVKEFDYKKSERFSITFTYASHNIDHFPGALFLRNWAIMYMNEVFKQIF